MVYKREQFPKELRRVFSHFSDMRTDEVEFFGGRYDLFHPFQLDPKNSVIAAELVIGEVSKYSGPFDCLVGYEFADGVETVRQKFEGKFVKHGNSASIFVSDLNNSHFVFYVGYVAGQNKAKRLEGIFIANVHGSERASAWPFYAQRLADGEVGGPRVMPWAEAPHRALRHFQRGAVHWEEDHFLPQSTRSPAPSE